MRLLRLRILFMILAISLGPMALLLAGIYWLPTGFLSFVWFGLLAIMVCALAVGLSGSLARPARELAGAFDAMMRNGGEIKSSSRWIPAEFSRIQRAFALFLKDQRYALSVAESQSQRMQLRGIEAERLLQRSFGILQALFETSTDGILVVDANGGIVASNVRLDAILGRPAEEIAGRNAAGLLEEIGSRFASGEAYAEMLSSCGKDDEFSGLVEGETRGAGAKSLAVSTQPIRSDGGEIVGRLWLFRDVTEKKIMGGKLQQVQKMEAIGLLAGGIAHDFNNLLTAIRGNLALAEMVSPDKLEEVKDKLQGATKATVRAAQLVKRLLGFSRKGDVALQSINVNTIVGEVEGILGHSIDPRVTISCELEEDLWLAAADPVQVEQVILNVCLNARDALPETGGKIEIFTSNHTRTAANLLARCEASASECVLITVKDDGCGISPENRERVFEPFFSTKEPGKGTGLGLAMSRAIIEEHGGWIEFDSEVGKGTEFRIYLPKALAAQDAQEALPQPEEAQPEESVRQHSGTILVVDDEAPVRCIAVSMLKYMGYNVIEAADGQEALDKIENAQEPIDAILLDIYMPKLSGRDTFKRLRAKGCQTPVVVCSGFMVDPDEFMALSEGGNGPIEVLQKPYSMEVLARTVAKAIAASQPALPALPA